MQTDSTQPRCGGVTSPINPPPRGLRSALNRSLVTAWQEACVHVTLIGGYKEEMFACLLCQ